LADRHPCQVELSLGTPSAAGRPGL
jgi:hypothetical protein